jgi:aryl-alcohol dehydrogenase-like predicted oxidoreductase
MEYTTFGSTGMTVSRICLGCMSFGTNWDEWTLDREESHEVIERAIDLGINFFDTANVYSYGESEEILGEVLSEYDRDEMVVATKGYAQMREGDPNSGGLSRKALEQELDASLSRLDMDTVDLYQIHRWDYDTPIETTLRALDDAVRRGKTRHVGASSMWAHQFAEALHLADSEGLERFVSMQNLYNLAYREEEREMLPLCANEDVAVMPWSPLAAGYLTRPHEQFESTTRGEHEAELGRPYKKGGGVEVNERVEELAEEKGVKMAQLSLSWLFHKEWVTTPILGTSSVDHLEDAVEALDISLSDSDVEWLEEPYRPVPVSGHE